jgi:hypothetical protein
MDCGRAACAARSNLYDFRRDSLGRLIGLGAQAKRMADTRVSSRHAVDKLGIEPSMLEECNRFHGLNLGECPGLGRATTTVRLFEDRAPAAAVAEGPVGAVEPSASQGQEQVTRLVLSCR